jgi:hypothetical protein
MAGETVLLCRQSVVHGVELVQVDGDVHCLQPLVLKQKRLDIRQGTCLNNM